MSCCRSVVLFSSIALILLVFFSCERVSPSVYRDESAALEASASSGKRLLVYFGADWCEDCRILEHEFEKPEVVEKLKGYVFLKIDATRPSSTTDVLMEKYGVEDFPFLAVDGVALGYLPGENLTDYL